MTTLLDRDLQAGKHSVNFNATDFPSGLYEKFTFNIHLYYDLGMYSKEEKL